jgi:hypothetical protein
MFAVMFAGRGPAESAMSVQRWRGNIKRKIACPHVKIPRFTGAYHNCRTPRLCVWVRGAQASRNCVASRVVQRRETHDNLIFILFINLRRRLGCAAGASAAPAAVQGAAPLACLRRARQPSSRERGRLGIGRGRSDDRASGKQSSRRRSTRTAKGKVPRGCTRRCPSTSSTPSSIARVLRSASMASST